MLENYRKLPRSQQFAFLMRYSINLYFPMTKEVEEVRIRKNTSYPQIHDNDELLEEIAIYVAKNIGEYISIHKTAMKSMDMYKVVYWVGMFFYENDYIDDVSPIQSSLTENLQIDKKEILNTDMYEKITKLSRHDKELFFKCYGRYGLYHAFKLFQKNCH